MDTTLDQLSDEELSCWLAFSYLSGAGIGTRRIAALYEKLNSLIPVWEGTRKVLESLSMFTSEMIDKFLEKRDAIDPAKLLKEVRDKGIQAYPLCHPDYPYRLKQIYDPPAVLYVKGQLPVDTFDHAIGVVGTRRPTSYGQRIAKEVAAGLAGNGVLVVSGMAIGIDSYVHRATIEAGGKTVAVVASGVDQCYPSSNKPLYEMLVSGQHGAVVSEYFPGVLPEAWRFPARNRIISGLSQAVVVVEAGEKSGALITGRMAFEQSREVFAFPGRIDSPASVGTNNLIAKNMAKLTVSYEDVLKELNWVSSPKLGEHVQVVELFGREKEIYELLSNEPLHFDVLCERTGIAPGELSASLTMLELAGVVNRQPGDWYARESTF
jgi:DNA processing protein